MKPIKLSLIITLGRLSVAASALTILFFAPLAAADPADTTPKDLPMCKVSLSSLSKSTGAPGDTFEMTGAWEDSQGAKTAAINMGAGHKLDVIEWTPTLLKVRIPEGLAPGVYKVGVYCNNPPHWQGSGFMDFTVTAKSDQQASALNTRRQGADSPSATQGIQGQSVDAPMQPNTASAQTSQPIEQRNIAKRPPAMNTPPEYDLGNQRNLVVGIIILIFAAILAWPIYRYLRKSSKKNAQGDFTGGAGAQPVKSSAPDRRIIARNDLAPFSGICNKVKYTVENLGDAPGKNGGPAVPIMTISIDIDRALPGQFELNARDSAKRIPPGEKGRICMELVMLGADYIDVGHNTSRVAAEVRADRAKVDRALAEKIVEKLIKLRDLAQ